MITLDPPDLVVTAVTADAAVLAGSSLAVAWTVTNAGTGDTITATWTDTVFVSFDAEIGDADDRALKAFTHVGKLLPGESYDMNRTVPVPFEFGGPLLLYVRTDSGRAVSEFAGESNNDSEPVPVEVTRVTADLAITPTLFESQNGRLHVAWTVENVGAGSPNEWTSSR